MHKGLHCMQLRNLFFMERLLMVFILYTCPFIHTVHSYSSPQQTQHTRPFVIHTRLPSTRSILVPSSFILVSLAHVTYSSLRHSYSSPQQTQQTRPFVIHTRLPSRRSKLVPSSFIAVIKDSTHPYTAYSPYIYI